MQKAYLLKLSDREEGPYAESQIAQMFADRRVNRSTPCKPQSGGDWKTIDDYLPILKYGTQLPPPTPKQISSPNPLSPPLAAQRVAVVDLDLPFPSILKLMFKWMAAGFIVFCCFLPAVIALWLIIMAIIASVLGHALSPH